MLLASAALGQNANNLALDATVRDPDGGKLVGASVSVLEDGALISKAVTNKNGRFDLLLDFGHEYTVEISKGGYVQKKLFVNTKNVPEDEQAWGYEYGGLGIDLFKNVDGIDFGILKQPVAKIYYDPNLMNFTHDKLYSKQIKAQTDALVAEYEAKQKEEKAMAARQEADYQTAMRDGAAALTAGDLLLAQENYLAASAMKPSENAPKLKLAEIEKRMSEGADKEQRYMAVLAEADQLFGSAKYAEAKTKYTEASKLKPAEQYPKTRIAECDKQDATLAAQQKADADKAIKDKAYNDAIAKADSEFAAKNYANAKTYYQNALGMKPAEQYPAGQIAQIEVKLKEQTAQAAQEKELAALNESYNTQIAKADAAFNAKSWAAAKTAYQAAKGIKPTETYPDAQLDLIEISWAQEAAAKEEEERARKLEADYRLLLATADKDFERKNYDAAKSSYEKALALKDEAHAKARIAQIDSLLADAATAAQTKAAQDALNKQYNEHITSADQSFKSGDYAKAKFEYEKALEVKPTEQYPKTQLVKTSEAQATQERETQYKQAVAQGDAAFDASDYEKAKTAYNQALALKVNDPYATGKLAAIDQKLIAQASEAERAAKERELNTQYEAVIKKADEQLTAGEYTSAISSYREAQILKPKEKYPQEQIARANQLMKEKEARELSLAKDQKTQAEYEAKIKEADQLFATEDYGKARETYNLAAGIKANEEYPKKQVAAIDSIIAERKNREAELAAAVEAEKRQAAEAEAKKRMDYNNAIAEGNTAIQSKDWERARKAFNAATSILPMEQLPKDKLKETDDLEVRHKQSLLDAEFRQAVADADAAFSRKDYDKALEHYTNALRLKDDAHCQSRIDKINQLKNQSSTEVVEKQIAERSVSEEEYKEGNALVTIRKVTQGGKVEVYKRVVQPWGATYYFLNEQPITELVWNTSNP